MKLASINFNIPKSTNRAFSLIEISITIIIIGILIGGIAASSLLIKKSKISVAQTLTNSSPVAGIENNILWLETSTQNLSFNGLEPEDGIPISNWYDLNSSLIKNNAAVPSGVTPPTYANTINYVHAIKFPGTATSYFNINATALNKVDYTIFVLEKRLSSGSNYFFGDPSITTSNQNLYLGYSADGTIIHSQGSPISDSYTSSLNSYTSNTNTPRIFSFHSDSAAGKKTYINGILAGQSSSNLAQLTNLPSTIPIGKNYNGEIGELIIFSRSLTNEERKAIEDYLNAKWSVGISKNTSSCIGGVVVNNSCQASQSSSSSSTTCSISDPGSSTTTINSGSQTIFCDQGGYSGSATYNCSAGGVATATQACGCDSANNYLLNSGSCVKGCSVSVTGSSVTLVATGSGSIACSGTSYTTSSLYTCSNGAAITGTCPCASGYTLKNGACVLIIPCIGGDSVTDSSPYIHIFTSSSGSLSCSTGHTAQVLVVGGGGGGGYQRAGGGGGGGVVYNSAVSILNTYSITVGSGGAAATLNTRIANSGGNSIFSYTDSSGSSIAITALGGGGGNSNATLLYASNGGSGGGGAGSTNSYNPGSGTAGQGYGGGTGYNLNGGAGGGGGAGGVGNNYYSASGFTGQHGGNGGIGAEYSISGSSIYYGGGGGGGVYTTNGIAGKGGKGGGGDAAIIKGSIATNYVAAVSGTNNTGGGGGGGSSNATAADGKVYDYRSGAAGGSGIVIISYDN